MKAIVIDKKNAPDVLVLREVEKQIPTGSEVLVKIMACGINAYDYRSMQLNMIPPRKILGEDIAGIVEAVGNDVKKFKVGDQVFGEIASAGSGGFAEYVAVDEKYLTFKPSTVSFEEAAALPMAGVTALQGLRDVGKIQAGQNVLISGAGGGVGNFAVQLAKIFGAQVTAVCGPQNVELVRSLGADRVIDYQKEDFAKIGQSFDLILGVNGKRSFSTFRRVMRPNSIFAMAGGALPHLFMLMLFGKLTTLGTKKMVIVKATANIADLDFLMGLLAEGKIKSVIDRCYPLAETAEALRYLNTRHARGKVIIQTAL
jgi:NADPH:quinone reductase-like Zn-dependent oxidoreductase